MRRSFLNSNVFISKTVSMDIGRNSEHKRQWHNIFYAILGPDMNTVIFLFWYWVRFIKFFLTVRKKRYSIRNLKSLECSTIYKYPYIYLIISKKKLECLITCRVFKKSWTPSFLENTERKRNHHGESCRISFQQLNGDCEFDFTLESNIKTLTTEF